MQKIIEEVHASSPPVLRIRVLLTILILTVISTTVSFVGGLTMYLESIASLEDTVREVSEAQLGVVRRGIDGFFVRSEELLVHMEATLLKGFRIRGDVSRMPGRYPGVPWINVSVETHRDWRLEIEEMTTAFGVQLFPRWHLMAVSLITYDRADPSFFHFQGGEFPNVHHFQLFSTGYTKEYYPDNFVVQGERVAPMANFYFLKMNGSRTNINTPWDLKFYHNLLGNGTFGLNNFSVYDYQPPGFSKSGPGQPGLFHQWRNPKAFTKAIYTAIDVIYPPPPPPHPWSNYRGIHMAQFFVLRQWTTVIEEFVATHTDVKVIVLDPHKDWVYAAPGVDLLTCNFSSRIVNADECRKPVASMTKDIADCYGSVVNEVATLARDDVFRRSKCDGDPHFIRLSLVRDLEPTDNTDPVKRFTTAVMWMQKASVAEKKVQRALIIFIVFLLAVALFDFATGAFEIVFMARPMVKLSYALVHIMQMDLEGATTVIQELNRARVAVHEVKELILGLLILTRVLKEYRNYLPASVLVADTTEPEESSAVSASKISESKTSTVIEAVAPLMEMGLRTRKVTFVVLNLRGFFNKKSGASNDLVTIHAAYIAEVRRLCNMHRGVPDGFMGDRVWVNWNASKPCALQQTLGCNFVVAMSKSDVLQFELSASVTSGSISCGNMGAEGMKKYTFLGTLAKWSFLLERFNRQFNTKILVDESIMDAVSSDFYCLFVGIIVNESPARVYMLGNTKKLEEAEWMYQMQSETEEPEQQYNAAFKAYTVGQNALALEKLEKCSNLPLAQRLKDRIERNIPFEHVCVLPVSMF